jgi:hypothetical protein
MFTPSFCAASAKGILSTLLRNSKKSSTPVLMASVTLFYTPLFLALRLKIRITIMLLVYKPYDLKRINEVIIDFLSK